jgi:hypothetical protein
MAAADNAGSRGPATVTEDAGGSLPLDHGDQTSVADAEPVSRTELNAWRRGFTPQAEIWNGRLAMLGLSVGLTVLLIARLAAR